MSSPAQRRLLAFVVLLLGIVAGWMFFFRPPSVDKPVAARSEGPGQVSKKIASGDEVQRALEAARSLTDPAQRAQVFGRRLLELIARDPEAALAYVRQLPPGAEYTQGLLMVLEAIARSAPARALDLAGELASTREQRAVYSLLFARLAAANPAAAAALVNKVPAGDGRQNAVRALADGWARRDLPAARRWAQQLAPAERSPAMEAMVTELTRTDPLQAIEVAQQNLASAALERAVVQALQVLTETDPAAAAALTSKLPPGAMQMQAALPVARSLAARNPAEALVWARTLSTDGLSGLALNNILEVWAASDPTAAGQYVAQMKAGPEQEAAARRLAGRLARDPASAITWTQSLASGPARDAAVVSLASAWAQTDPASAARWASSLAASRVKTQALNGALSYWVLQDSRAAQGFVSGLADDSQIGAAASVAPGLAQKDPLAALAWTQTLSSPAAREAALAAAYTRWLGNAPAAARAWLAGADLSAATKAKLAGKP